MSLIKKSILVAALGLFSFGAMAGEPGVVAGLKFGKSMIDADGFDDGTAKGVTFGYDFGNSWSLELDVVRSEFDIEGFSGDLDWTAIYGVYRSEGNAYFLAKIGGLKEEISFLGSSESETGLSYGIGGGFRVNDNFSLEAEYTIIESDVNFLGLGARYKF
jgi:hypothetical protein